MHNANLVFMVNELLFGSIPARDEHFWIVVLWGLHYVLVSWFWLCRSGLVYYPFLDPTLSWPRAVGLHLALLVTLRLMFAVGVLISYLSQLLPNVVKVPLLYGAACSIMHTRFIRGLPREATNDHEP